MQNLHNLSDLEAGLPIAMKVSAVYIVILCSFASFGTDLFLYHSKVVYQTTRVCYAVTQAAAYLLYPLLGWLSDVYFTRYKVIRLSFIVVLLVAAEGVIVAVAIFFNTNLLKTTLSFDILITLTTPGLLLFLLSLGLFEANGIQFGMDQLLESSSDRLSSFIHWYYWSSYEGHFILFLLTAGMVVIHSNCLIGVTNIYPRVNDYILFCV